MTEMKFKRTGGQYAPTVKLAEINETLVGEYMGRTTGKTKRGKEFPIMRVRTTTGMEVALPMGGHLVYLVEDALKAGDLKEGATVRVTCLGWDDMEDGNKCRRFLLEVAADAEKN